MSKSKRNILLPIGAGYFFTRSREKRRGIHNASVILHIVHYGFKCREWCFLKFNVEERVYELAEYIVENRSTVRAAAKRFGISKSTVHTVVTK